MATSPTSRGSCAAKRPKFARRSRRCAAFRNAGANRLDRIRLDARELTERTDTSIKFLSDMFATRVFKLAAEKVGAHEYRRLVDNKLETATHLYQFMTEQFHRAGLLFWS